MRGGGGVERRKEGLHGEGKEGKMGGWGKRDGWRRGGS